jgi:hypothetical protein
MKVKKLRATLVAGAAIYEKAGNKELGLRLRALGAAIQPADKLAVKDLAARLTARRNESG